MLVQHQEFICICFEHSRSLTVVLLVAQAIQLLKTMDSMLEKTGVNNPLVEIQGPTQIHNLLQLIKKEQNIYDVVFAEVKFCSVALLHSCRLDTPW